MKQNLLALALIPLIGGCALTLGDNFEKTKAPYGMSMIYIYAGDDVSGSQEAHIDRTPETASGTDKVVVVSDGYFPYPVATGPVRVFVGSPDSKGSCVSFLAQEGAANYFRVRQRDDELLIEWMDPETALPEIGKTRRMSKEVKAKSTESWPVGQCLTL